MRNIVIIGSGGHSRSVISIVKNSRVWNKIFVIDLNYSGNVETILGAPVVGDLTFLDSVDKSTTDVFVAIGNNLSRSEIFGLVERKEFNIPNLIHTTAIIDQDVMLGYGNYIGAGANLGPKVKVGNGNIINTQSNLDHESMLGNFSHLSPSAVVCGRSAIGSLAWLGANSTVIDGIEIADETIIGAGSVVIRTIKDKGFTFTGIPAKKI